MDNKLTKLLEIEAAEISTCFEKAGIEGKGTPQEVADRREEAFKSFLAKYFPFPFRIIKGNISDSYGRNSQSIDCIVINPSHPYTIDSNSSRASIIFADGVDYAIEIKPDIKNNTELERALKQIQSVKKLRRVRDGLLSKYKYSQKQIECAKTIPCFIFAETTYSNIRTLIENIITFYEQNHTPPLEQFDLILINNRVLIYNFRNNSYVTNNNFEGIAYWEGNNLSIALFLFELNKIPKSEPDLAPNIMTIYLNGIKPKDIVTFPDLNKQLQMANAKSLLSQEKIS